MIEQLKTIREALRHGIKAINHLGGAREAMPLHDAMPALTQLEAMAGEQEFSLAFYKRRCDALQKWQSKMRDPERTVVCDILANGCTLEPPGNRYTAAPVAQQPQAEKPLAPLEPASSYVQPVPDHCDRIVWRNRYYHLPLKQPQADDSAKVKAIAGIIERRVWASAHQPLKIAAWRGVHVEGDYLYYDEFPEELTDEQRRQLHLKPLYEGAAPQQVEAVPSDVVRDAERYRKFRSAAQEVRNKFEHYAFDALDAAIDAAIAQQKGN